jgi:predicted transposase/invertase (TIGR01784 family)
LAIERLEVKEMEQAVSAYRQITGSQEYQELERMRDKARHDEAQALGNARRKAQRQEKIETAKRLLALGIPVDLISAGTGLSCEEIESLK